MGKLRKGRGRQSGAPETLGGARCQEGPAGAGPGLLPTRRGQSPCWLHPPQGAQPCAALPLPGPGAGSLPPELSLPLANLPSLSSLWSSPPCPLPPSSGSLILSSWKPDSLFPSSLPLPLSPSWQAAAPPSPGGALGPQGCLPAPLPRLCPHPRAPREALQLFQPLNYREVEGKEPGPRWI